MSGRALAWLDTHRSNHITGSNAAMNHGQRSIYESLQLQADAMLLRIRTRIVSDE